MGKITFNGKDLTKPFTYNGKQVVSLTYNGKVCTLKAAGGGTGSCGVYEHTFDNGVQYSGTLPADITAPYPDNTYYNLMKNWKPNDNTKLIAAHMTGMTSLKFPGDEIAYIQHMPDLVCLEFPELTNLNGPFRDNPKLESLIAPEATRSTREYCFYDSPFKYLYLPKFTGWNTKIFGGIINDPSTSVTLPSSMNTNRIKDGLFGAGHWDRITFTWV